MAMANTVPYDNFAGGVYSNNSSKYLSNAQSKTDVGGTTINSAAGISFNEFGNKRKKLPFGFLV